MAVYDRTNLRNARLHAGLTQQALADAIGRTSATVARYEAGSVLPTARVLGTIATALGISVGDLYDADDSADPVARFDAELRQLVDAVPEFTPAQKSRLRVLLRPTA